MALPLIGPMAGTALRVVGPSAAAYVGNKIFGKDEPQAPELAAQAQQTQVAQAAAGAMGPEYASQVAAETESHHGFRESGGRWETVLAAGAGALAGGFRGFNDSEHDNIAERIRGGLGGAVAGGVSAGALKLSHDAIQGEGGGLRAGITGAISAGAASFLDKDGPGAMTSAAMGFGAGSTLNLAHDELTERGHGFAADGIAGAGLGATGGYVLGGDLQSAGIGAAAGGLGGAADSWLNRTELDMTGEMPGMVAEANPLQAVLQQDSGGAEVQQQTDQGYQMG